MKHNIKVTKKDDDSSIEIEGEITAEAFEAKRASVLRDLNQKVKVDGFRSGHIPENILIQNVGEMTILEEMAEQALADAYPSILIEHEVEAIGRPEITVTKLAAGNPLGFKAKQAVMPNIKLPDYKKIAEEITKNPLPEALATDEEVTKVLEDVQKSRTPEGGTPPELNDDFAKTLGNFETLEQLKNQIKDNIVHEKVHENQSKRRIEIMDKILSAMEFAMPAILVDRELENMMAGLKNDLARTGIQWDDYLKHIKKTEDDIRDGMRKDADRKARIGLVLRAIAKAENIEIPNEELELETAKVLDYYKGADTDAARHYVEGVLKDEQVLKLLEGDGPDVHRHQ